MNAFTPIALPERLNAWHNKSGVGHCTTCNDTGIVASQRRATVNDPYPEATCDDCYGMDHACEVCGNTVHVQGFDCLVCDMALEVPGPQLDADTAATLAAALVRAVDVAAKHRASIRSGEVSQPIPDARWMAQAGVR